MLREVPPNSTVVGVPGIVVKQENRRIPREDLDQVHLPDPVMAEIAALKKENEALRMQMKEILEAIERK